MAEELRLAIASDVDIVHAREKGRELAAAHGFTLGDQTVIATAISEVARNILLYARRGEVRIRPATDTGRDGLVVIAEDHGPGIRDIAQALQDGFSTSGGLGLGLPGARRLMDDFDLKSAPGQGTTVTMAKWKRSHG
ncbi:MAG: ATP-binding protein [Gemmatimonadetes bacterium 13_1_40CM_4_69_8]|nr:MAG: ATP-binding protein [Gemmatimonadetes bacterium 13_1_40CM_4_69_8]